MNDQYLKNAQIAFNKRSSMMAEIVSRPGYIPPSYKKPTRWERVKNWLEWAKGFRIVNKNYMCDCEEWGDNNE